MKNNQLDNFESLIKSSLDKHKVAYDPSDWNKLDSKLNQMKKPFYSSPWFIAASILAVIGTTFIILNISNEESSTSNQNNHIVKVEPNNKDRIKNQIPSLEEEVNDDNVKEIYIESDKQIKTIKDEISENKPLENKNSNSETKNSDNEEVKIEDKEGTNLSGNDDLKPLDSEENTTPNYPEETPIAVQKASFYMNTVECCEGTSINFIAERQKNVDYLWSFDDGNYSKLENPSHTFEKAGSYKVNLIVRSQIDNSIMSKSNDQLLIVNPNPKVDFEYKMNKENGIPYTSFINLTDMGISWNWSFGDGELSIEKDPNHTFRKKGVYLVSLTVSNMQECSSTFNKEIMITDDYNLLAPNSFTPNGDGLNDYFLPAALNRLNGSFTMTIYSQTEGLIYETTSISQPWDGTNQKMGSICKEGSYIWVVKLKNKQGRMEQYKGAILLLK